MHVTRDGVRLAVCDRCNMTGDSETTMIEDNATPMDEMLDNLIRDLHAMVSSQHTPLADRIVRKVHELALVVQDTRRQVMRAARVHAHATTPETPEVRCVLLVGHPGYPSSCTPRGHEAHGPRCNRVLGLRERSDSPPAPKSDAQRASLAVDLMKALGISVECDPTPTFAELLGKVGRAAQAQTERDRDVAELAAKLASTEAALVDAQRFTNEFLDDNGEVSVVSRAAYREARDKACAELQNMSDLAAGAHNGRDMAIREREQLKAELAKVNAELANVRKVDANSTAESEATNLAVTRELLGDSEARRREAESCVLADEEFIVALRREARGLQREIGHLIVKLADAERAQVTLENTRNLRQATVIAWMRNAFGGDGTTVPQRGIRLLEETLETYQAAGCDQAMAHELVDYVFKRPVGDLAKELGGVGVCVLGLAAAAKVSADDEEAREVERVLSKGLDEWRQRNAAKNEAGFAHAPPSTTYEPNLSELGALCKNCGRTAWSHSASEPRICAHKETP